MNYTCDICGFVYKEDSNETTKFEDLPNSWFCPICGASKESFSKKD